MDVLWGSRVIVLPQEQPQVLEELHEAHTGISKMKMLACSYVWWPKLDNDMNNLAKNFISCQVTGTSPPKAPLHPWECPAQPCSHLYYTLILQHNF